MAWTEQDYQEIVARLMAGSIGVNEVPNAEDLDNISSLPAYQPANETGAPTVVKASLELLAAPALEAADKANAAATKAESNATAAQTAANTANEKAELAAQAASDANAAKEGAVAATQSANNAASNAEEKAAAANTAAQDAEKVANNPTYIGTDHYVYVYNKETDSFDKTGIYCKGEPGSSFRVAGEYATLEALKSAVPDGSAVDGFMAVGTEAPYDYYAWVNGDWVNQGKIAGGGSGSVVNIPSEVMRLTSQSTSDEILNAFGGRDAFLEIAKKTYNEDVVLAVPTVTSPQKISYISSLVMASYTDNDNAGIGITFNAANDTFSIIITLSSGNATCSKNTLSLLTEAPSNSNAYGRKNKGWVEVPEKSDVLTKDNETEYTPTKPYHPATKDYVDTVHYGVAVECDGSYISENNDFTGASAVDLVKSIFTNYQQIVTHIITLHKPLFIHINGNYSCIACNSIYAYKDDNAKIYELSFTYTLSYSTRVECKIFGFHIEENTEANSWCIIKDLIKSDNLTTLTKKTAAEYEALGSKDANTVYCVTD